MSDRQMQEPLGAKLNPDGTPNYEYLDGGRWWERKTRPPESTEEKERAK